MITEFDISKVEIQCNIGEKFGMDDHFDIARVFEIGKFDITRLTCISNLVCVLDDHRTLIFNIKT